jgi:hypothetical protein
VSALHRYNITLHGMQQILQTRLQPEEYIVQFITRHEIVDEKVTGFMVRWFGYDSSNDSWNKVTLKLNA